jgi:hypothetical protein
VAAVTRYEVIERIGSGRVAEIFRGKAIAAGGFEKPVAIKRILPQLSSDPRFVELLIAEAKLMSVLRHRNIVQVFDVGVGDDGEHFLVMEFVDGVDLGALQRHLDAARQRLPLDLALHLGAELCEALDHAQQVAGPDGRPLRLIHRDVTPSNVLVSRAGEIKLTDFGLAKRPDDGTSAGGLRGRYGYVSPEQASGQPVDARSDVFAVGLIVWELAVGRRLYSGLADFDALRAVREGPAPRAREHDPTLPPELDAVLDLALARDPRQRLPNAGELGKRLRGLRYSLDVSAGDPAAALARLVVAAARTTPRPAEVVTAPGRKERTKLPSAGFDAVEPTVLRIRTADGFASDDEGTSIVAARRLLDRFEEDETRMAALPAGFGDVPTTRTDRDMIAVEAAPLHLPPDDSREFEAATQQTSPLAVEPPRPRQRLRAPSQAEPPPVPPRAAARPPASPPRPPATRPTEPSETGAVPQPAAPPVYAPPVAAAPPPGPAAAAPPFAPPPFAPPPFAPPVAPPPFAPAAAPQNAPFAAPYPRPGTVGAPRPRGPSLAATPPDGGRRWLVIGLAAAVIAVASFLITRAAIAPEPELSTPPPSAAVDAGVDGAPR